MEAIKLMTKVAKRKERIKNSLIRRFFRYIKRLLFLRAVNREIEDSIFHNHWASIYYRAILEHMPLGEFISLYESKGYQIDRPVLSDYVHIHWKHLKEKTDK